MCMKMEEALVEHELHAAPKLFLMEDLDKDQREKVKDIAKKRQLAIVDKEDDATHILHPVPEADDESYARAVFKRGEKCLVHFYRFPESRDNWGTIYPPEDKEPPEFGEEPYREEQVCYIMIPEICNGGKFEIRSFPHSTTWAPTGCSTWRSTTSSCARRTTRSTRPATRSPTT